MKLREHKGNKSYKITWSQRTPCVVESHLNSDGTLRKVLLGGVTKTQRAVYATGQNPTATLNAFLFGRDRTNITARIEECAAPILPECHIVGTQTGRRSRRPSMRMLAYVVALSTALGFGGGR